MQKQHIFLVFSVGREQIYHLEASRKKKNARDNVLEKLIPKIF